MDLKRILLVIAVFGIFVFLQSPAFASGSLSGHAGIYSYSYGDSVETGQSELLTNFSFKIRDDSGLALRFNGRLRSPLTDGPVEDWSLYSSYLSWASKKNRVTVTAGRRLLYKGVIRGIQDGGVIELRRLHRPTSFGLMVAVGKEASYGLETGPADNPNPWTLGLIAGARPLRTLDIKLSTRINLEDEEEGAAFSDLVGVSAGWKPTRTLLLDGLIDHDLTRERVERSRARISVTSPDYTISAEYLYAASRWIPESSWYSRFDEYLESYSQYRMGFNAGVPSVDWLSAGLYWIVQDDDDQSVNGYVSAWGELTLGYRFSGNGDIRKNGIYGYAGYDLNDAFRVDAGADFSKYKVYSLYDLPSYGSFLRLGYDPLPAWYLYGEVQYRKDQVMDEDVRMLVGARYRFKTSYGNKAN